MGKITEVFGQNIKRMRIGRGWTQSELARRCEVSLTFLQNIEAGRRWVGTETVAQLARGLEVGESELFLPAEVPARRTAPPQPDPKEVLLLICQAFGYELPAPVVRRLRASRAPSHHLHKLPPDIYASLVSLCQGPECEWDSLRKVLRRLAADSA